ncbi:AbrB/MazE/SpoVT family DNA-binding domain-containing protein [Virgibacillus sp.]|uniref:AbrB/MazE/SpoVT family DNA-binding domain-containing protein n=1 Tax=Virgibacillus sp. TaxID=1872700 RepID=UPI00183A553F|nr:AbrB/MazE/SpoVT family DNA-binding domain-containing protein [Virgibacillus sp.]NWO12699.1 hypothetical protein [Virgibacillus sp.]
MNQATLTSKGQVTIPKEIREFLELHTGDHILFETIDFENRVVSLKKDQKNTIECPVCGGKGFIYESNESCFVCDETGTITIVGTFLNSLFLIPFNKYRVALSIVQKEIKGKIGCTPTPQINLASSMYSRALLDEVQSVLQAVLNREYK